MTAVKHCFTPFSAQVIRATRVDTCGIPVIGSKTTVVSDGVISVAMAAQLDTGNETIVKNAAGAIKVSEKIPDTLKWYDTTITMTGIDPDLYEMATGQTLVTDYNGDAVGIREGETIPAQGGIALETWTLVGGDSGACDSGAAAWVYFLLPYVVQAQVGDITLDENALSCVLKGQTHRGSGWGIGPYNVVNAGTGGTTASKLATAIGPFDHRHMQLTTLAPPTAACGAIALAA